MLQKFEREKISFWRSLKVFTILRALVTDSSSPLSPLRSGTFRSFWFANMFSNFGGLIQGVGAAWMMTLISDSASMVALVQASTTLPIMLLSLLSGAIADSFARRKVMLSAQVFMLAVSITLAVTAWSGLMTPWLLLAFTFLLGCGTAINNPSWQATVGDVVPREELPSAVLLNSVSFNVTRSVAPAIGGAIVAALGAAAAFAVNAASYLGVVAVLMRWRPADSTRSLPREGLGRAIRTGVRYVSMSPNILRIMLRGFAFGFSAIAILALLPLVARHMIGGGAVVYGILLGAFGVGAVVGAFMAKPLRNRLTNEMLVRCAFSAFAFCSAVTALSTSIWLTGLALMLGGASWVMSLSLFNTTVQLSAPRWVVGRALSMYQMASFGGMAGGSWLWGAVAERHSPETALLFAATGLLIGVALGFKVPLPSAMPTDLGPLDRWQAPHLALDVVPQSGPVAVSVEYLIEESDIPTFVVAMTERRRIRRRDGAADWHLMRDMANPSLWTETYSFPTWSAYLRFHARTTREDATIGDRIRALHCGTEPPRARQMLVRDPGRMRTDSIDRSPLDIH